MQLPRYHRLRRPFYRLEGSRCASCDRSCFPPREMCPGCRGELERIRFSGAGEVYSYSRLHQPPRGFASLGPYTVAMVALVEGPLIMAQLTDLDGVDPWVGMPVEMVTRKLRDAGPNGYIVYGYKFRPRLDRRDEPGNRLERRDGPSSRVERGDGPGNRSDGPK